MTATQLSRIVADFETSLSAATSISDTSFTIQSVTDSDGTTLSDGIYCFTLDRDNSTAKEYVIGQLTASTKTVSSVSSVSRQGALTTNLQKAHRIGTNVIISDHSALNAIVKILNGTGTLNSGSPISYDSTATISGANMLATKAYVDSVVNGGTVTYDKQILANQTAGETIAISNLVYLKEADSRWYLVDTDVSATYDNVTFGIAMGSGTSGNTITGGVQVSGICSAFTGLTANDTYYATATAGAISTTPATPRIGVGIATSTTSILLAFNDFSRVTGQIKDALAGTGTPSSSNKFVTEDTFNGITTILDLDTTGVSSTTTTEITVYTKDLSSETFGINDGLHLKLLQVGLRTYDVGTNTVTLKVKINGTTIITKNLDQAEGTTSKTRSGDFDFYIKNNGSLSSQKYILSGNTQIDGLLDPTSSATYAFDSFINTGTSTVTLDNVLTVTLQRSSSTDSQNYWTYSAAVLTKLIA